MTTHTLLSDPQEVIGKQWSEHQSPEQAKILGLARDALLFVSATGQRYRFEDFRKSLESGARAPGTFEQPRDGLTNLEERLNRTEGFFTKLRDEADSTGEKELIQVILDTLHFISSTGQHSAFSEYLEHVEAGAPPYAIASFDTKEEAEAWLGNQPSPPVSANVLIANDYHDVLHNRETNIRRLPRNHDLEYYLAELKHEEPPVATASFASLEEAKAWLKAQPEPARWAWVSIAGEFYLAAYHPNINHRALYPLSMAKGYEVEPDEP
ncbi:hypothetical protein [Archangium sp.]|uniref:hypothetical protein n=1 Tax=Archangium sp. TaxID=1872627 RepID=UPI002D555332|nr:hypothetical protein [Archangium sp.]HYO60232.1 hypothetical protein [Archangium sp.]